jgi:hypothetical protein
MTEAERFDIQNPGAAPLPTGGVRSWWSGSRRASSFRKTRHTRSGSTVGNTEATYRSSTSSLRRGFHDLLARASRFDLERSAIFSKTRARHGRGGGSSGQNTRSLDGEGAPEAHGRGVFGGGDGGDDDAFARRNPAALQSTVRSARCRLLSVENTARRGRVPKDLGRVTLHVLHAVAAAAGGAGAGSGSGLGPAGAGVGAGTGAEAAGSGVASDDGALLPTVTGPEGIHEGRGLRVVLANRDAVLVDQVLPPSCFSRSARGIAVHVFAEKEEGGLVARGGVSTIRREVLFLSDVGYSLPLFFSFSLLALVVTVHLLTGGRSSRRRA